MRLRRFEGILLSGPQLLPPGFDRRVVNTYQTNIANPGNIDLL
jgi:hypothetical protein